MPPVETTIGTLKELVGELGLKPSEDGLFYGKVKGFPVGFKVFTSLNAATVLFHIRSPFNTEEKTGGKIDFGTEINRLIADHEVEVSFDNRIVWLTFVDGIKALTDASTKRIFLEVLDALEEAGLKGESERCHYCLKERAWDPVCINGKVALICPACTRRRSLKDPGDLISLPLKCLMTVLIGALVWSVFWILYDLLFESMHTTTLYVPHLLITAFIVGMGAMVGAPIGWAFKNLRKQNAKLALTLICCFIVGSALLGEVFYATWWIDHVYGTWTLTVAVRALPTIWANSDGLYVGSKVLMIGTAIFIANAAAKKLAKPKVSL